MKRFGFKSKGSLAKSIQELIMFGYIVRTRMQQCRMPALYAMTWFPINKARSGEPYDPGVEPGDESSDLWRYTDLPGTTGKEPARRTRSPVWECGIDEHAEPRSAVVTSLPASGEDPGVVPKLPVQDSGQSSRPNRNETKDSTQGSEQEMDEEVRQILEQLAADLKDSRPSTATRLDPEVEQADAELLAFVDAVEATQTD